jgi:translocation and assembly module TamA
MKQQPIYPASFLRLVLILGMGLTVVFVTGTYAADPQPYEVAIAKTGNAELDQMLLDVSTLASLKDAAPVGSFA